MHISILHSVGSSTRIIVKSSKVDFHNFFSFKDFFVFLTILLIFFVVVFFYPNALVHSDNYIKANPLVTPTHIVPE